MDKKAFAEQLRVRQDELNELEAMVEAYARKIKNVTPLMRGNMITAYRIGLIDCMDWLDQKAQDAKAKRDMRNNFLDEG